MKCSVFKDLLSVYQKGLTSEESNTEIKKHLEACAHCRAVYEKLPKDVPGGLYAEEKHQDFLKKPGLNTFYKRVLVAASACVLILAGLFIFSKAYKLPLPFDQEYMSVESYKTAMVTEETGYTLWVDVNRYDQMLLEDSGAIRDAVRLVYHGIDNISGDVIDRTINRNGQTIKVFYYYYEESLWDHWFSDPALRTGSEIRPIYGDGYQSADYKPQMIEIYYVPLKKISGFERLSDEDYDRQREKGSLIWSGIV